VFEVVCQIQRLKDSIVSCNMKKFSSSKWGPLCVEIISYLRLESKNCILGGFVAQAVPRYVAVDCGAFHELFVRMTEGKFKLC
jgi:hypothetical protein